MNNPDGELIGTIYQGSESVGKGRLARFRQTIDHQLQETIISGILNGAGYELVIRPGMDESGNPLREIYAQPPITDPAIAQELGHKINELMDLTVGRYPGAASPDTFTPAQTA